MIQLRGYDETRVASASALKKPLARESWVATLTLMFRCPLNTSRDRSLIQTVEARPCGKHPIPPPAGSAISRQEGY